MGSIVGTASRDERIRFGRFEMDLENARLTKDGRAVPLRPKTFAVLAYLAGRPGRLTTKQELLDAVWPDTSVSDTVLKVCIREAREALEDTAASPRFIETAHRRGYRFIARVTTRRLPQTMATLIERPAELRALRQRLEHARLLTLTGPGGCGKTSLALELARTLDPATEVYWVELDAISDAASVPRSVARAVSILEQEEGELDRALCRYLAVRGGVLVLDNCEHWLEAVARLVTLLLTHCSTLKVVATSRESLRSPGEQVFPVPPLEESEAIALFRSRAEAAVPGFGKQAGLEPHVAELCRRLDCLPLAIELAAIKVESLGLQEILERFGKGAKLLDESSLRGGAARHRTLRAAIDWSYRDLGAFERTVFRRLSVFAGSFSSDSADAVCATEDTVAALSRLVETSLLVRSQDGRFRFLETIRHYARGELEKAAEEALVSDRLLEHMVHRAEQAAKSINGAGRSAIVHALDRDHSNLATAFRYGLGSRNSELVARLARALVWFWFHRGYWAEGRESLARARGLMKDAGRFRPSVLFGAGLLDWVSGDAESALSLLSESVALAREVGDGQTLGYSLLFFGMSLLACGRLHEASRPVDESVSLFRARGDDPFGEAVAVASRGIVAMEEEDYPRARKLLEESVAICRESRDDWALALALRNLGIIALRTGDFDQATRVLRDSLRVQDAIGEKWFLSRSLETLAAALALRGDVRSAAVLFGAGEALRRIIGASILPNYRKDDDRGLAAVRAGLSPHALQNLWAEGLALDSSGVWRRAGL